MNIKRIATKMSKAERVGAHDYYTAGKALLEASELLRRVSEDCMLDPIDSQKPFDGMRIESFLAKVDSEVVS